MKLAVRISDRRVGRHVGQTRGQTAGQAIALLSGVLGRKQLQLQAWRLGEVDYCSASLKWGWWCCSSRTAHAAPRCLQCLADRGGCWVHGGRQQSIVWVMRTAPPDLCLLLCGGGDLGGVVRVGLTAFRCLLLPLCGSGAAFARPLIGGGLGCLPASRDSDASARCVCALPPPPRLGRLLPVAHFSLRVGASNLLVVGCGQLGWSEASAPGLDEIV